MNIRRNATFHLIFTEPGVHLLVHPCTLIRVISPTSGPSKSLTFADAIKEGEDGAGGGGGEEGGSAEGGKKKEQKKPEPCFPPFITRW